MSKSSIINDLHELTDDIQNLIGELHEMMAEEENVLKRLISKLR